MDFEFLHAVTPENLIAVASAFVSSATITYLILSKLHSVQVRALQSALDSERSARERLRQEAADTLKGVIEKHEREVDRLRIRYETEMNAMRERIDTLERRWEDTVMSKLKVEKM